MLYAKQATIIKMNLKSSIVNYEYVTNVRKLYFI